MLIEANKGEHIEDFANRIIKEQLTDIRKVITAGFNGFILQIYQRTDVNSFIQDYNNQWDLKNGNKYIQR